MNRIGPATGIALLTGAILGPGILVLPGLAVRQAGPASVLAWAVLVLVSVPIALTFAELGVRHPDGGGVATFVARAFGNRPAAAVGWWFYFAIPIAIPAASLVGARYVAPGEPLPVACGILGVAFLANRAGLRFSGRIQLVLVGLLMALLLTAVLTAAPHVSAANLSPHDLRGVPGAIILLFFGFVGWEASSNLSADLTRLRIVTWWTLVIIGVLYLALAVVTVGVLGHAAGTSAVPLTLLLEQGIGGPARVLAGAVALLLTFGAINAYIASGVRLGAAMARDGALPGWAERRSLELLVAVTAPAMIAATRFDLATMLRSASACLAAVTAAGAVAAVRLIPGPLSWIACVLSTGLLVLFGAYLAIPAVLAVLCHATVRRWTRVPARRPGVTRRRGSPGRNRRTSDSPSRS